MALRQKAGSRILPPSPLEWDGRTAGVCAGLPAVKVAEEVPARDKLCLSPDGPVLGRFIVSGSWLGLPAAAATVIARGALAIVSSRLKPDSLGDRLTAPDIGLGHTSRLSASVGDDAAASGPRMRIELSLRGLLLGVSQGVADEDREGVAPEGRDGVAHRVDCVVPSLCVWPGFLPESTFNRPSCCRLGSVNSTDSVSLALVDCESWALLHADSGREPVPSEA